jgi:hypothetical protein
MAVAIRYEPTSHAAHNGNGHRALLERRRAARHPLSVPVRVRTEHVPWFEEAMTLDVSAEGLRFISNREYAPADPLFISFNAYGFTPWPFGEEVRARILRVEPLADGNSLAVIVQRLP